ncbi:hypothetical protein AB0L49_49790 [Streptomyces antimycoticus]
MLTSLPAVCFALFGAMVPRLTRHFGIEAAVCGGMSAVAAGLALRPLVDNTVGFLLLSVCSLMGIAVGNVLVPVVVERHFPHRVGAMTGLSSMALALGTAVPAAVAVPVAGLLGGGWRGGLSIWAAPAALAYCRGSCLLAYVAVPASESKHRRTPRPSSLRTPRRADWHATARRGRSPATSVSSPPAHSSPWGGCRSASATRGSRRAQPDGCSP